MANLKSILLLGAGFAFIPLAIVNAADLGGAPADVGGDVSSRVGSFASAVLGPFDNAVRPIDTMLKPITGADSYADAPASIPPSSGATIAKSADPALATFGRR